MTFLHSPCQRKESGFTLIELMVSMLIALIILAGLYASFSKQSTEYSYQNQRVDTVQDLEFGMRFIVDDLRAALISVSGAPTSDPIENANFLGNTPTTSLTFWVWDSLEVAVNTRRARRAYTLVGTSLRYDRESSVPPTNFSEILPNVTFFKIFKDNTNVLSAEYLARAGFAGIPNPLPALSVNAPSGNLVSVPGYTILIEVAVQTGYNQGLMQDVRGNPTTSKRVWRYVQVHPKTVVN